MRTVKFIKAHPAGISEGKEVETHDHHAERWVNDGYAEYIDGGAEGKAPVKDGEAKETKSKTGGRSKPKA